MAPGIERCLLTALRNDQRLTARENDENNDRILTLLYQCVADDHFLGFPDNLTSMANLCQIVSEFGWERSQELVCNLGAKLAGRRRSEPQLFLRVAIETMKSLTPASPESDDVRTQPAGWQGRDEDAFAAAIAGADVKKAFEAVGAALKAGLPVERVIDTFVLQQLGRAKVQDGEKAGRALDLVRGTAGRLPIERIAGRMGRSD